MNTIYSSTVIRPISFVSCLLLLLGFSIVIDIKNRKADRIKFTNAARSLSGITHEKWIHRKEAYNYIKKAEREAAANGRAAAGSAADFLRYTLLLKNKVSHV